ncbi:hypothetical protein PPERSA_01701 [Pseudocohnilembus persalinus]|uniref:Uncharacterized protein n=1 Tax=Pseudocohnilembus persalinus TaxID=266149 RepID=A0A0V0R0W8_PSEPJ|nr:hypothetical protein PPERSA_01701 [Pseudocohnilembus persalinus]|eukprot:KRX08156.1 hypothetical protein PPERSA_01701 [Pseudocohnilembus persalinus]
MQKDQEVKVAVNGFQQKQFSEKNNKQEKICIKSQELNKELQSGKLVDWQNIYHPSFEEQLHNNIKQMDYGILKNQDPTLAQEQKMMKYAQEFKKTLEQRQILKQKIEKNVQQGGKKLDEFFEWEEKEQENRLDQHQIFLDYAKKVQSDQINPNPLKNIPSYNRQNL